MIGAEFFQQMAGKPPFSKMHPKVAAFFREYLAHEKAIRFQGRTVINTHFPPYPSPAFDNLAENLFAVGDAGRRRLYSVTLAVTNRCHYRCWHCYNAGRSQKDLTLEELRSIARQLQELGVVHVTLTGGEPLLRDDLESIAAAFSERVFLTLNTTGDGLTPERARALKAAGVFGAGISIDSTDAQEHDRLRGREGAFRTAVAALETAADAGLYPYIISVATHSFLERERFGEFLHFAREASALEIHLLEPSATGRLRGATDALLTEHERALILEYQSEAAQDESLPILSSFLYLEGADAFGCGAGLTHLYIDGSGEVCPCNLVPLSFGNAAREPLADILACMSEHFRRPRCECIARMIARNMPEAPVCLPLDAGASAALCAECLPREHPIPRFFQIRDGAQNDNVGAVELRAAYDAIHDSYDNYWLQEAAAPIKDLVERLMQGPAGGVFAGGVFEAGCGTGYATVQLLRGIRAAASESGMLTAADISENMMSLARRRLEATGLGSAGLNLVFEDALDFLRKAATAPFDLIFSSWVLGYIPLESFFRAARQALTADGRLAFIVHKENSPRVPLEIFAELVADDPSILLKRVAFDFPRDAAHARALLQAAGLEAEHLEEGAIAFRYDTPEGIRDHLMKSGAGTAFYDALDPARRPAIEQRFLREIERRARDGSHFTVTHEYISCIARPQRRA
ncbi:MAG: radical SAM protein [Candidatus Sumerlaeota bacterium]|nr:radical SAM protein [Candidatus Sumerlaeota bacterium]